MLLGVAREQKQMHALPRFKHYFLTTNIYIVRMSTALNFGCEDVILHTQESQDVYPAFVSL